MAHLVAHVMAHVIANVTPNVTANVTPNVTANVIGEPSMLAPSPLPRNLEASFRDLSSEREATRVSAVRDVVRHALRSDTIRARAIPRLATILREDLSPSVRAEAAVALADVRAEDALPVLLFAVEDENAHVRQMALSALGEIGDARSLGRLERALADSRPEVRYQALIAYARVAEDQGAVGDALAHALDDSDGAIRYIAMRIAEERLVTESAENTARRSLEVRAQVLIAGADASLAVVAGLYLARLGRASGLAIVSDVVAEKRRTPELEDEQACVELAGELGLQETIPHLERRAWGTRRFVRSITSWGAGDLASCAWHARIALARMGHPRASSEILNELNAWRRETREAAVVAAGRARLHEARERIERLGESVDPALVREALARLISA
jgi:HEAT repeat protein